MTSDSRVAESGASLHRIGQIYRTFIKQVDEPLRQVGLAVGQLPVLVTLKNAGASSQAELARVAQVEQPSMAQLLNRMERDGLIERVPDPADGRSRLVSLTGQATRRLPAGKAVMDSLAVKALEGFSREERDVLQDLLSRIQANLERVSKG
ncbi:MAG: Transcriptional regulator SlyA [Luteibacter sp.]|uniref:MarR family winged helix-turn-helix transcriptional regulator n=1 Tax=Luteibacter sp. TaxID=1886636 RepID=UPI00137DD0FB|nr:MarR family transcriptional regulator [Luteibacter sp.]KAF1005495.1 MAG: Transcriptional regulator SlyA [Luteibacter sp.]